MGLLRPFGVLEQANFSGNFHQNTGNFTARGGGETSRPTVCYSYGQPLSMLQFLQQFAAPW
jgi:hypothetical protein